MYRHFQQREPSVRAPAQGANGLKRNSFWESIQAKVPPKQAGGKRLKGESMGGKDQEKSNRTNPVRLKSIKVVKPSNQKWFGELIKKEET